MFFMSLVIRYILMIMKILIILNSIFNIYYLSVFQYLFQEKY